MILTKTKMWSIIPFVYPQVFEGLASKAEAGEKSLFNARALEFYRRSVELDLSQTDLLLRIGELMLALPIEEHGKAT